jgi:alkaline phosphatase
MITRRKFFTRSAVAAGSVVAFPHVARPASALAAAPGQKPARIIHMVADGMSLGTLTCADYLSQHVRQRPLTWVELCQKPEVRCGFMNMRSLNSMVTDSSAASSSWGSGSRVVNGALNQLPSGESLTPLYTLFAQQGWKRGLVTTTEITHATPAGFAASADSRDNGTAIAAQYLEHQVDVLLGGGQKFFDPAKRKDKRDLKAEFAADGYRVLQAAPDLADAPLDQRWLGIFQEGHLPFTIDRMADPKLQAVVPTLAEMTGRALEWLGRHEHFILQVEGGRVDHGAHNCDAAAALRDLIAFDEALDAVLEFQRQQPDTLVVLTTDHGNGNMGVNASGRGYGQSSALFHNVAGVKASFVEILRQLRKRPATSVAFVAEDLKAGEAVLAAAKARNYVPSVRKIQEIVGAATGYKVSDRRARWYQIYLARQGTCVYELMNSDVVQLGQLLANHIAVGWTGAVHTSDYVPVTACGPGAERFQGFIQNTDVFRNYTDLAGIDFRNPAELLTAALGPEATDVENPAEYAWV